MFLSPINGLKTFALAVVAINISSLRDSKPILASSATSQLHQ